MRRQAARGVVRIDRQRLHPHADVARGRHRGEQAAVRLHAEHLAHRLRDAARGKRDQRLLDDRDEFVHAQHRANLRFVEIRQAPRGRVVGIDFHGGTP